MVDTAIRDKLVELMDLSTLGRKEVMFSWADWDAGLTYHFASGRLVECAKLINAPTVKLNLTDQACSTVEKNGGIEQHRLDRLRDVEKFDPILVCEWTDGKHFNIDGNHRMVAAWKRGDEAIDAWVVKQELWQKFLIGVTPGEHLPAHSGIE